MLFECVLVQKCFEYTRLAVILTVLAALALIFAGLLLTMGVVATAALLVSIRRHGRDRVIAALDSFFEKG